ncbi:hypothetical protein [Actinomyces gaoshouyii]|uniref:hypothetical protein n=1 Tax=Actinomyces gaoshouyii TaxID=1960083 RepID=UPI0013DDE98C|nr:hypothetical protein [Actinomyces gaoshouyii]
MTMNIMPAHHMVERVCQAAADLTPALWEAQSNAIVEAHTRCAGLTGNNATVANAFITRSLFVAGLRDIGLPNGWTVTETGTKVTLEHPSFLLRYLKEKPGARRAPAAGHNQARRTQWAAPLFDVDRQSELLLLWSPSLITEAGLDGFAMRVAHPKSAGDNGPTVDVDLSIRLQPEAGLDDYRHFVGDPSEEDLYARIDAIDAIRDGIF